MIKQIRYCDYCDTRIEKGETYYRANDCDMCERCNKSNRKIEE